MKSPARSSASSPRGRPYDRHSGSAYRGLPKKNGAGAKGVWGSVLDQAPVTVLDKNDPNYDSDEEIMDFFVAPAPAAAPATTIAAPIDIPAVVAPPKGNESAASSLDSNAAH